MATVDKRPKAEDDLFDIWYYIAIENNSRANADRFMEKIDKTFQQLAQSPMMGISQEKYGFNLRRHVFGNYLIFYSSTKTGILIERVLHGMRDTDTVYDS